MLGLARTSVEPRRGGIEVPISVVEAFVRQAERLPEKPCVFFEGQAITYGELRRRVEGVAAAMRGWGMAAGDRVALYLENSPDFIAAYLGVQSAGGVVVLAN